MIFAGFKTFSSVSIVHRLLYYIHNLIKNTANSYTDLTSVMFEVAEALFPPIHVL